VVTKNLELFRTHRFRHKGLSNYCSYYSKPRTNVLVDGYVAEKLRAQGFDWEEDPRSVYDPTKLYEALSKYAPGQVQDPVCDANLASGLALARICFAKPESEGFLQALPFTLKTIDLVTRNPEGSAGLTAFGLKKKQAHYQAYQRGIKTLKGSVASEACIAFARTQFNNKTRLVWCYPYSETVIEGMIALPLIERYKGMRTPMAFAATKAVLGFRLRASAGSRNWAYSIDMSSFDSSISRFLISQAFTIMKTWFKLDDIEPTSGKTIGDVFKHIEKYFTTSPIVMPDGNIYYGRKHGVPSGSYFTQLVDSIVNVIIAGTISRRFNLHLNKKDIFVLGDDLLVWSDREMDLDTMAKYASHKFGVVFNPDKSRKFHFTDTIHYLGKDWCNGIPTLPIGEILKRMALPERFRKYDRIDEVREKQVQGLFVSFAMEYHAAWEVMVKCITPSLWFEGIDDIQYQVYGETFSVRTTKPEWLSGSEAYRLKYLLDGNSASSLYERVFL